MSEYIMDPGARLMIGPHGRPMESLGTAVEYAKAKRSVRAAALGSACCASCGTAKRCGLGADPIMVGTIWDRLAQPPRPRPTAPGAPAAPPGTTTTTTSHLPLILGIAGVAGVFFFMRRRKRH